MQRPHPVGLACRQAGTEEVLEQVVQPIPSRLGADSHQEQVGCFERLEPVCCIESPGDGPAALGIELVECGDREEEVEGLFVELSQYLANEVAGDAGIRSVERPHEGGPVGVVAERQRCRWQSNRPAFRPLRQHGGIVLGEVNTIRSDALGRLAGRDTSDPRLATRRGGHKPATGEWQGWEAPGTQDQCHHSR